MLSCKTKHTIQDSSQIVCSHEWTSKHLGRERHCFFAYVKICSFYIREKEECLTCKTKHIVQDSSQIVVPVLSSLLYK